ncbi:hypothetical protein HXX76_000920 [Chlamydomonas incerta]|uniref:Uncharacterized protein n=1 Tax=Chlamydomonas incerta TaxID=51695 RepID=A0A836B3A1_CHLIN|nr:hypothetical protein HXX76_000920 [Chlamydomonas incerta]|eukprot:KAG2446332.1 hypothetical protein HXX76_000920 [Chlamydomonas incerta]
MVAPAAAASMPLLRRRPPLLLRRRVPEDAPDSGSKTPSGAAAAAGAGAGHRSVAVRQFRFADMRAGRSMARDVDTGELGEGLPGNAATCAPLPENATEEERRAYEMRRARTGAYGDGRVGPVDTLTLQREMRRKALLDQMKNNAWS